MRMTWIKLSALTVVVALLFPVALLAQKDEKEKDRVKKDVQQIIITRKGGKGEKIVVEIVGDKITVNGKSIEELKDSDVSVRLNNLKDIESLTITRGPRSGGWNFSDDNTVRYFNTDMNRAMLGVMTEKEEGGVKVTDVTKESAAEKIGLKEGDIITKIGDSKIEDPDDLSSVITKHKVGDKVTITWLRDKKEHKATAELTKWKGANVFGATVPGQQFKFDMDDMNFEKIMPRIQELQNMKGFKEPFVQNWNWSGNGPKLGLSVQDTDEGKGVKVIEVDDESNAAKSGIKKDDIITDVDGKTINNTDDMVKVIRESKDKISLMIKLQRDGKTQNIEVKMPRKIKTADL